MADTEMSGGALNGAISGAATGASVGGPWGAVIGAVIGLFMGGQADKEKRKQLEEDYKLQVKALVQNYNYANQGVDLELMSGFDQSVQALQNTQVNSIQNQATIRLAAMESGLEGNSIDRVMRITKGSDLRAEDSIKENYGRLRSSALMIKQTNQMRTQFDLDGVKRNIEAGKPNQWSQLLQLGSAAGKAYGGYVDAQAAANQTGRTLAKPVTSQGLK
ncbi:hypothetical protein DBR00_02450 [Pseudomonas sp. HMWF032]|uniref:virion core protein, T7 gp14 family n=1 Tax=Pseudomonas sp. HMWF032 TaxID=2056866 RepID=UPI000D3855A6|nr:glycine zipper domain-containing protein [Pseudomonas sp. HMWF032]PTS86435.1 hypothetical protein DBR00_02450 [Pseudomonas sp. HMWF032]PTT81376.1 hypothetical protein DBR41_17080 [Pseudomonas sp. HMWF010]